MLARLERRVTADRSFADFGQTLDDRQGSLRWRARPGAMVTTEVEGTARRQIAEQRLGNGSGFRRTLDDRGGTGQLVVTPGGSVRAAAVAQASWSRPAGQIDFTRTLRFGPDLGVGIGAKGRAEISARRAFISGPPPVGILPTADPVGAPRWEGTARVDYRVRESTTLGLSFTARERPARPADYTGRAEMRAFF